MLRDNYIFMSDESVPLLSHLRKILYSVLKVVWKSWGTPSHHLPLSLIFSLSLPPHCPWAGGWAPRPPYFKPWLYYDLSKRKFQKISFSASGWYICGKYNTLLLYVEIQCCAFRSCDPTHIYRPLCGLAMQSVCGVCLRMFGQQFSNKMTSDVDTWHFGSTWL